MASQHWGPVHLCSPAYLGITWGFPQIGDLSDRTWASCYWHHPLQAPLVLPKRLSSVGAVSLFRWPKKDAKALETTFFRQNLETSVFVAGRKNSPLIKPPWELKDARWESEREGALQHSLPAQRVFANIGRAHHPDQWGTQTLVHHGKRYPASDQVYLVSIHSCMQSQEGTNHKQNLIHAFQKILKVPVSKL